MKNRLRTLITGTCFLTLLLLASGYCGQAPTAAQSDSIVWSEPINLSNTAPNSEHPAIVADSLGYVHVLWSEDFGGEPFQYDQPRTGNSIFYVRWDGVSWTAPVDILSVPSDGITAFVSVDVDKDNRLHAVWTGQSNFYYSNAPSWLADSSHAWSTPLVVAAGSARSTAESDIAASDLGNLHIVYATRGDDAGVYHIRSEDGGLSWATPVRLSTPLERLEIGFSNVRAFTDAANRVHVVWQTNQRDGFGQAVYYARSTDDGATWSPPVQLGYRDPGDFEASLPYLVNVSESEIHLIYLDGPHQGRSQRISHDGGETWTDPMLIITDMEGVNGYVQPVVDGAAQMHLIINMRTRDTQVVGIYYARWLGDGWSPVAPVVTALEAASGAHYTASTVCLGNEIHVVWNQIHDGEIWTISGWLPSVPQTPRLAPPSLPALVAGPTSTGQAEEVPLPTVSPGTATVPTAASVQPSAAASSVNPVVLSLVACSLLMGGAIVWTRLRSR